MTPTLARHLLKLDFSVEDKTRMNELAARNRSATISDKELSELDNYVRVGTLLSILQSRARKFLKDRNGNGRG